MMLFASEVTALGDGTILGISAMIIASLAGVVAKLYSDLRRCEAERREEAARNQERSLDNQKALLEGLQKTVLLAELFQKEQRNRGSALR